MELDQARNAIETGSVLIRDGATLPDGVSVESESFVPGWKLVTDCDRARLDRDIHKAGWRYFCVATVIKATTFGKDRRRMIRGAIGQILKNSKLEQFNSLEIVQVESSVPVVLRLGCVTVSAQPRHIQQSMFLTGNDRSGMIRAGSNGSGLDAAQNRITKEDIKAAEKRPGAANATKFVDENVEEIAR